MNIPLDQLGPFELPAATATGPTCGNCHVRHESVEAVRFCFARRQAWADESRAERDAELANERALEDAGFWEARAQEEWELARGILQP